MKAITFKPIGIIYSRFQKPEGTPIQPSAAKNSSGKVMIFEKYTPCLKDLEGFSHLFLIYHFNYLYKEYSPIVKPFLDDKMHGVFATRAPNRPNPIGLSIVKLNGIDDNILFVSDLDIIDETPLLDIKPFVPDFDNRENCRIGWLEGNIENLQKAIDDGRFI